MQYKKKKTWKKRQNQRHFTFSYLFNIDKLGSINVSGINFRDAFNLPPKPAVISPAPESVISPLDSTEDFLDFTDLPEVLPNTDLNKFNLFCGHQMN